MRSLSISSNKLFMLLFLAMVLSASISQAFSFYWLAKYENQVMDAIVGDADKENLKENEVLVLMGRVHRLVGSSFRYFHEEKPESPPTPLVGSPLFDLLTGAGACGSYTAVLGRVFDRAGIPIRIAQMSCVRDSGEVVQGCHMLIEAHVEGKWSVFDAMYNLTFRTPEGLLAGFEDVSQNWKYYRNQTSEDYPQDWFTYHEVRYTNWDKVPVLMPAIREVLGWGLGEKIETLSVRAHVLDKFYILFLGYLFFSSVLASVIAVFIRNHYRASGMFKK